MIEITRIIRIKTVYEVKYVVADINQHLMCAFCFDRELHGDCGLLLALINGKRGWHNICLDCLREIDDKDL